MNQTEVVTHPGISDPVCSPDNDLAQEVPGAGEGGIPAPANVFTVEAVYDYAYVQHSAQRLGCRHPLHDLLVRGAMEQFARRLGSMAASNCGPRTGESTTCAECKPRVVCRRVWCVVAEPVNVHPADKERLRRRRKWLAEIGRRFGFKVLPVRVDWHGFRLRREDRRKSTSETERQWEPEDKGTDVTMALLMLRRAEAPDRPDGLLAVTGDADLAPALKQVQELRPPVRVVVAGFAHALSRVYSSNTPTGYEWEMSPIVLDPYLTPAPGEGKVRVAAVEVVCAGRGSQTKEGTKMVRVAADGAGGSGTSTRRAAAGIRPPEDIEVGRIAVNRPKRGELHVYRKRDGAMGSTVLCEEDGGKYGVALGVLKRFAEVGTYAGWAYVDEGRGLAFKFVVGEATAEPNSLLAIDTSDGRVDVPPSSTAGVQFEHGAWVAFYWRLASRNGDGKPRRQATRVYGLDSAHLPLIARLIADGKIVFPEHAEVLDTFFAGLSDADVAPQDTGRFKTALDRLVADSSVPSGFQVIARVERSRLTSGGVEVFGAIASGGRPTETGDGKTKGKTRRARGTRGSSAAAGDIVPLDLDIN